MKSYLIFTDLDGTLLNHHSYSFGDNIKIIQILLDHSHQIIINSSKTFLEILKIRKKLGLESMPFSCENGAVIYYPKSNFQKPLGSLNFKEFWKKKVITKSSQFWHRYLLQQNKYFKFEIAQDLPIKLLKERTGLKDIKPMLSREGSQLIIWKDSQLNLSKFKKQIKRIHSGVFIQGGRFIQLSSSCSKRISTKLISHTYFEQFHDKYYKSIIAIGDNQNDIDMLNYAKYPCLIKSNKSQFPKLYKNKNQIFQSRSLAPKGWKEVIKDLNLYLNGKIYQ